MSDDDLDLDLDEEPVRPAKASAPRSSTAPKPVAAAAPAPAAKVAPAVRVGLPQRALNYVRHPRFTGRTFVTILIVLLAIVLIAQNSAPVRFYFFGLALELPKSLAFLIDVAIGAALMWLWLRRQARPTETGK